jgi:hypothetical protein
LLCLATPAGGQTSTRLWREDERVMITDLSNVTAVAATTLTVYAATPFGLAVYDRLFLRWRLTVGPMDGYPTGAPFTVMVADPTDDTAWLGGRGRWASWQPLTRRWDTGVLPGSPDLAVLDSEDPTRGVYFRSRGVWYFVSRGGGLEPAGNPPPPGRRLGGLTIAQLEARAPALDAVRLRIERDDYLRSYPMTSAAAAPVSNDVFIGTAGNGLFRLDVLTYSLERLPAGLLTASAASVTALGDLVCAGGERRGAVRETRYAPLRGGVSCFENDLTDFSHYEGGRLAGFPGTVVRRLLLTRDAVWAATDQGAIRIDRRNGAVRQLLSRDGLHSDEALSLARAPDGVWIGTSRGVAVAPDSAARVPAIPVALTSGPVLALAARADTLWIGTAVGLEVLLPGARAPVGVAASAVARQGPIVALALAGDTLLVATDTRLLMKAGEEWSVVTPAGPPIGRYTALAVDRDGFWVAGTLGIAFFRPPALWRPLNSDGDVPQPVADIAASGEYVWVATRLGVVRYLREALVP